MSLCCRQRERTISNKYSRHELFSSDDFKKLSIIPVLAPYDEEDECSLIKTITEKVNE